MESVWDYPRPHGSSPPRRARVELGGVTVADSERGLRVLETSQAPAIYFPADDVSHLEPIGRRSMCEWKGRAVYFDVWWGTAGRGGGMGLPRPVTGFEELRDYVAFYPQAVDACWLGDEQVEANAGDFYGGWITSDMKARSREHPGRCVGDRRRRPAGGVPRGPW